MCWYFDMEFEGDIWYKALVFIVFFFQLYSYYICKVVAGETGGTTDGDGRPRASPRPALDIPRRSRHDAKVPQIRPTHCV